MDLTVQQVESSFAVSPGSALGLFWLQAHFPTSEWDDLLSGRAVVSGESLTAMTSDARDAGLSVEAPVQVRF